MSFVKGIGVIIAWTCFAEMLDFICFEEYDYENLIFLCLIQVLKNS